MSKTYNTVIGVNLEVFLKSTQAQEKVEIDYISIEKGKIFTLDITNKSYEEVLSIFEEYHVTNYNWCHKGSAELQLKLEKLGGNFNYKKPINKLLHYLQINDIEILCVSSNSLKFLQNDKIIVDENKLTYCTGIDDEERVYDASGYPHHKEFVKKVIFIKENGKINYQSFEFENLIQTLKKVDLCK